jgi:hypothetical protein
MSEENWSTNMKNFTLVVAIAVTFQTGIATAQRSMLPPEGSPGLPQEGTGKLYVTSKENPGSLYELCSHSHLIVVGVVQSTLLSRQPSQGRIETDAVISVEQTLKGTPPGPTIAVTQSGGTIGKITLKPAQYQLMQRGERYILFLNEDKRTGLPAVTDAARFQVTGVDAGLFFLNQGMLQFNAPRAHGLQMQYVGLSESVVIKTIADALKNGPPPGGPFVPAAKQ